MLASHSLASTWLLAALVAVVDCKIDRESIIRQFNLRLNQSHAYSPVQVGNGNFAFGADVSGLQTFLPHNTLSSWGWHNSSLPTTPNQTAISDFTGQDWWTHGRLVNYNQPNPAEKDISQWLIANPHRINLGRIGLWFGGKNVTEDELTERTQTLDLWEGTISSSFSWHGKSVTVKTIASPEIDTIAVTITSELLGNGELGVFFDFPYASGKNKFDAPFVGLFNATSNHTTTLTSRKNSATITHTLDATTYDTEIRWESEGRIQRTNNETHSYVLTGKDSETFAFTATFAPKAANSQGSFRDVKKSAKDWWKKYWSTGAFISLPSATNSSAKELQRRIVLTQYLLAVNGAGKDPAQESGLVNNGWYGKYHCEMIFWHLAHWTVWNKWDLYNRTIGVYERFLPSSYDRAKHQGYQGARIGKMQDDNPSGWSAPGEINSLLIWQQPHPMWFAEMEYRKSPTQKTLQKWDRVLAGVADFMASYAWYNQSTKVYDLGPPMYPVSENTNPNQTVNPTFELAYWRFGLDVAAKWKERQHQVVPASWRTVKDNLASFPIQDNAYVLYEGVEDMWTSPEIASDHPGFLGLYGWLPPDPRLNLTVFQNTVDKVYASWDLANLYGWDFPLMAMAAARLGDGEQAVRWLLDVNNQVNELGMPEGGNRVATPYFPASAGMLLAVGMMAGGWDGLAGSVFPEDWDVEVEGFQRSM
ncbi:uncharacterized protein CC84DRAFT_1156457 [Paraphaeosphaeria sporulosa]|uniref:Six-hairpin glycosidase n=1 Tax=Paraphaeosphaeria sporulosa TaxID=1460663 RepID=A0A177BW88_9PLEO|nr:uncharacterized protein CC84DRAFT_1156457 [Paraphaeosphaeria sporulosa]OAF99564.1 hypothetical protein CC84DRAFT_1156457 [Paraphaeosphaeria sporulosa]